MDSEGYLFQNDDLLVFADEKEDASDDVDSWKILIIDDEQDIHNVTKMVLKDVCFDGKKLEFQSCFSGETAKTFLKENDDIAVILLDVVMEKDTSGLDLIKFIREEIQNTYVRIILRTGYPGEAPEREVILNYDINDYKEKTELTSQKLFTSVIAALRAYKDIVTINSNNKGLEKIIDVSSNIFELQNIKTFPQELLESIVAIIDLNENSNLSGMTLAPNGNILAGCGRFEDCIGENLNELDMKQVKDNIERSLQFKRTLYGADYYSGYFMSKEGNAKLVYVDDFGKMETWQIHLLDIFDKNVGIAFDNRYLNAEIENTQSELIFTLGEVVEVRSEETGNHVRRVAEYCKLLALSMGIEEKEAEMLRIASPMHDLGKIGIPDNILHKPGKLTDEEFVIMKRHTTIGYEMLKNSNRSLLKMASIVALEHHEYYDGNGYPRGLAGDEIHIYGRIMAICDVFDALTSDRVYRKAWPVDKVLDYIRERIGSQFDPNIAKVFFDQMDDINEIRNKYSD